MKGNSQRGRYSYLKDKLQIGLQGFIKHESFGGILLVFCVFFAMVIANSAYKDLYFSIHDLEFGFFIGDTEIKITLSHFINDVLMSLFFLLVGLEMKREVLYGELAGFRKVTFSFLAALGGVIVPILFYLYFTHGTSYEHGFGVVMSMDTAFTLGILLLFGSRVPNVLKVFLVTLAVVDDLLAIGIIAFFYSVNLQIFWLLMALVVIGILGYCNWRDTKHLGLYIFFGSLLWICIFFSGVHVTIAAVILAFIIPGRTRVSRKYFGSLIKEFERTLQMVDYKYTLQNSYEKMGFWKSAFSGIKNFFSNNPNKHNVNMAKSSELVYALDMIGKYSQYAQNHLLRLEHFLQPIGSYFIIPVFAFTNAGIDLNSGIKFELNEVMLGTILGLVLGKPIGIFLFAYFGEKLRLSTRPEGLSNIHILAVGVLSGIGFTMSIFVANLAYTDEFVIDTAKLAILCASAIAGILGIIFMYFATKEKAHHKEYKVFMGKNV